MNAKIKKGIYQHYKGNYYEIIDSARHTETLEEFVIYRALYGNHELWIRPLAMFLQDVEIHGIRTKRFQYVHERNSP